MGKAFQGIYGSFVNKVGNVVGRVKQGVQIYSIYQPSVANPRTTLQVNNRSKFSIMTKFVSACINGIRVGFKNLDGYKYGSAYSSAVGYNLKTANAITGTAPNFEIDYTKAEVSVGSVDLPFIAQASVDSNQLTATWADNSGMGKALATDKVCILAYNKRKNQSIFDAAVATRPDRNGSVTIPTSWNGDDIEAYLFMNRADNSEQSKSVHLGNFTI